MPRTRASRSTSGSGEASSTTMTSIGTYRQVPRDRRETAQRVADLAVCRDQDGDEGRFAQWLPGEWLASGGMAGGGMAGGCRRGPAPGARHRVAHAEAVADDRLRDIARHVLPQPPRPPPGGDAHRQLPPQGPPGQHDATAERAGCPRPALREDPQAPQCAADLAQFESEEPQFGPIGTRRRLGQACLRVG